MLKQIVVRLLSAFFLLAIIRYTGIWGILGLFLIGIIIGLIYYKYGEKIRKWKKKRKTQY